MAILMEMSDMAILWERVDIDIVRERGTPLYFEKGVHGFTERNLGHDSIIGKGVIYILKERGT